ncbi:MAG: hypothetical protein QGI45_04765 [Myxococcota bacterium]|jgi:hypothetical protein|nr:hypothetical protein [Myxococcota bacterium]
MMKKYMLAGLILLLPCACGQVSSKMMGFSPHKFEALVKDVRLQGHLIEKGRKDEDMLSVTVPAVLFAPAIVVDDVRSAKNIYGEPMDTYIRYIKANIDGKLADILSFWTGPEHSRVAELFNNPEMLEKNRTYFKSKPGVKIVGMIKQAKTVSLLVGDSWIMGIPMQQVDGQYKIGKSPDDLELAIVEASYR